MKKIIPNNRFLINELKSLSIILLTFVSIVLSPNNSNAQAGAFDESFQTGSGANQRITTFLVLPNDKILIGGRFTSYDGVDINRLARIMPNGERDITFQTGIGFDGEDDMIEVITSSGLGDYYVGGVFSRYNGVDRKNILRLNGDGQLDPAFNPGSGPIGIVLEIAVQMGNKVLVGGGFETYNGQTARGLLRVMPDGTVDQTFVSLLNNSAVVNTIFVDDSFKTYIGGSFGSFDGQPVNKLAKLLPDGGLDGLFEQANTCNSFIDKILPSVDGNFYIIGNFTEYAGVEVNKVAKINSQGSIIESFNVGSGPNYYLYDAAVQSDGKIILVGNFSTFNGLPANGIVRLMPDGSVDQTFITGSGNNGTGSITKCGFQSDGKIIISGNFTEYNGNPANKIARIHNDINTSLTDRTDNSLSLYPNPGTQSCLISGNQSNVLLDVHISDIHGRIIKSVHTYKHLDISDLVSGLYFVRIVEGKNITKLKLIVN